LRLHQHHKEKKNKKKDDDSDGDQQKEEDAKEDEKDNDNEGNDEQPSSPKKPNKDSDSIEVEEIIGKREKNGRLQYFVKWKGYDSDCNSWEDSLALSKLCPELMKNFPDIFHVTLDTQIGEQIVHEGQVKCFPSLPTSQKEGEGKSGGSSSGDVKVKKVVITNKKVIIMSSEDNTREEYNLKGMEIIETVPKNSKLKLLLSKGESGFIVHFVTTEEAKEKDDDADDNTKKIKIVKYNFMVTGGSKVKDLWILKLSEAKIGEEGGLEGLEERERLLKEKEKKIKEKERKLRRQLEELKLLKRRARAVAGATGNGLNTSSSGGGTGRRRGGTMIIIREKNRGTAATLDSNSDSISGGPASARTRGKTVEREKKTKRTKKTKGTTETAEAKNETDSPKDKNENENENEEGEEEETEKKSPKKKEPNETADGEPSDPPTKKGLMGRVKSLRGIGKKKKVNKINK